MDKVKDIQDQFSLLEKEIKELREAQNEIQQKLLNIHHGLDFLWEDFNNFVGNK